MGLGGDRAWFWAGMLSCWAMKILHIGKYYPPFFGGMETYLQQLAQAQVEAGMQVEVVVHQHEGSGVTYEPGQVPVTRVGVVAKVLFTPIAPRFRSSARAVLRRFRPEILHLHMPNPSVFWMLTLPEAKRIPWVVHWHSDVVSSEWSWRVRMAYPLYRPFEHLLLKHAAQIIATSPPYLETSLPLQPFRAKAIVVPLGMGVEQFASDGAAEWPAPGLRVLAAGRFTYYKGFEFLLRAAAKVPGISLVVVGSGELAPSLKALAKELGLEHRVSLPGRMPRDRLYVFMRQCDLFCLPSIERTEAFGMVLLEAAQCGKAAVVSDIPGSGVGYVVEHGQTGLKMPVADVDALAAGLQKLVDNPILCHEMGQRAQQRFDKLFKIEVGERAISELYGRLLAKDTVERSE